MSLQYALDSNAPETFTSWRTKSRVPGARQNDEMALRRRSYSFLEGTQVSSIDVVMEEFRHNGIDTPYDPNERTSHQDPGLSGLGPARRYLKQMSCPAESSLEARQQADLTAAYIEQSASLAASLYQTDSSATNLYQAAPFASNLAQTIDSPSQVQQSPTNLLQPAATPTSLYQSASSAADFLLSAVPAQSFPEAISAVSLDEPVVTEEQLRVLSSLPTSTLHYLLREMETRIKAKPKTNVRYEQACRFCKNNGERESYYTTHCLRAEGRVACPVLRALVCRQCGAHGDRAHTIKYCPLTSPSERKQSTMMMQSKRLSSGRRRVARPPSTELPAEYVRFGEFSPSAGIPQDGAFHNDSPLDPMWAALERKLML